MTDETKNPDFSYFHKVHFLGALKLIEDSAYISPNDLAKLLRDRRKLPVPEPIIDYIAAHLAGEVSRPKGRPAQDPFVARYRNMFIKHEYTRLQALLAKGELSDEDIEIYGEEEPDASDDYTLAVRAARLVARAFLDGAESYRTAQNIASAQE